MGEYKEAKEKTEVTKRMWRKNTLGPPASDFKIKYGLARFLRTTIILSDPKRITDSCDDCPSSHASQSGRTADRT